MPTTALPLVLASTSPWRRALLERLELPFEVFAPEVDETPAADETPQALVARLAEAKARAGAARFEQHLLIGSDQVAELGGRPLGKPGGQERALEQLTAMSGREICFHTGLCLYNSLEDRCQLRTVPFRVAFRQFSRQTAERYLQREQPYDCAGSFKMERLGIALFRRLEGEDPNSLIGLPLIALIDMLETEGVVVI